MKKMLAATAATVAVAAPLVAGAVTSTASAAYNPPCMTRAEFSRIHTGQSAITVARIVGSAGKVTMRSSFLTIRQWKTCPNPYGSATVGFSGGRVQSKIYIG